MDTVVLLYEVMHTVVLLYEVRAIISFLEKKTRYDTYGKRLLYVSCSSKDTWFLSGMLLLQAVHMVAPTHVSFLP